MTNLIQSGTSWQAQQLLEHCASAITYTRTGLGSVSCSAVFGRSALRVTDDYGNVRLVWTDRDFLVARASLVLSGNEVTPQAGDRIAVTAGGKVTTYEVLAPFGEAVWTWACDGQMRRIRTKQISESEVGT